MNNPNVKLTEIERKTVVGAVISGPPKALVDQSVEFCMSGDRDEPYPLFVRVNNQSQVAYIQIGDLLDALEALGIIE